MLFRSVPLHDFNEEYEAIGLDESLFYDAHHLDAFGADLFSHYFAGVLSQQYPELNTAPDDPVWEADLEGYRQAQSQYPPPEVPVD